MKVRIKTSKDLLHALLHVAEAIDHANVSLTISTDAPSVTLPASPPQSDRVAKFAQLLEVSPFLTCTSATLTWPPRMSLTYRVQDGVLADIDLTNPTNEETVLSIYRAIHQVFDTVTGPDIAYETLPPIVRDSVKRQEHMIDALASSTSRINDFLLEQTETLSKFTQDVTAKLETKFQSREQRLADEHTDRLRALEAREEELRVREQDFDYRESTAVRRDLLPQIRKALTAQSSLKLSDSTINKRRGIHAICLITLAISLGGAVSFAVKGLVSDKVDWHILSPLLGSSTIFATTLIYYIRWIDHWFTQHAETELANRKYENDILRASWLAELLFEGDKDSQLPDVFVERVTEGLFKPPSMDSPKHPADDAAELLKSIGYVRITKGGIVLSRTKRALKDTLE